MEKELPIFIIKEWNQEDYAYHYIVSNNEKEIPLPLRARIRSTMHGDRIQRLAVLVIALARTQETQREFVK
jgi:hypothetical protein